MSLKLFRHTDYAQSILSPGETRFAMHPAWAVAAASGWLAVACNVWLWQAFAGAPDQLLPALVLSVAVLGSVGFLLSLLGWRRTFKPAATLLLFTGAALAAGALTQAVGLEEVLPGKRPLTFLPPWTSLFHWQVPLVLALLGLAPAIWLWNARLRRMPGPTQLRINVAGMGLYGALAYGGLALLARLHS